MFYILTILIGITLGQHIKIAVSPELQAFFKASWAQAESKALPMAQSAVEVVKQTASKQVKRLGNQKTLDEVEAKFLES